MRHTTLRDPYIVIGSGSASSAANGANTAKNLAHRLHIPNTVDMTIGGNQLKTIKQATFQEKLFPILTIEEHIAIRMRLFYENRYKNENTHPNTNPKIKVGVFPIFEERYPLKANPNIQNIVAVNIFKKILPCMLWNAKLIIVLLKVTTIQQKVITISF